MPRKLLIRSSTNPYHVTARGNNREAFHCDPDIVWKIFCSNLREIHVLYQVKIHAFVLMPNHFHLLISTPQDDIGVVMQKFLTSVTKAINSVSGRSGRVFGARYHWSLVNQVDYCDSVLKYIYRNPVKAKLCLKVEDYQFSTLNAHLEKRRPHAFPLLPIAENKFLIPHNLKREFLFWLNQAPLSEHDEWIRDGLKKAEFRCPKKNWSWSKMQTFKSSQFMAQ